MAGHSDWRDILQLKGIKVKEQDTLAILNYDIGCDFTDPIVQEARGIIIDTGTLDVVCWPFRKFGNVQEAYADEIDWGTARVQEKIDGSIVKLWFNRKNGDWQWSTNSMIDAEEAEIGNVSFLSLIKSAVNYSAIQLRNLNPDCTYIFELVGPGNRVVIGYDKPELYHIGTRNNLTGKEEQTDVGIRHPSEYALHTLQECLDAVEHLNAGDDVEHEGFVVVDANWNRVKIKSPEYLYAHHLSMNHRWTKNVLMDMILHQPGAVDDLIALNKDAKLPVRWYQYQYALFRTRAQRMMQTARALYEEYSHDRKAVAEAIKSSPYAVFGFKAIGNEKTLNGILAGVADSVVLKYIEEMPEI